MLTAFVVLEAAICACRDNHPTGGVFAKTEPCDSEQNCLQNRHLANKTIIQHTSKISHGWTLGYVAAVDVRAVFSCIIE